MSEKVLCVDDDPKILRGYRRHAIEHFDFEIAEGGEQGLEVLKKKGPFAVVVSDMRMPVMDGIQFLTKVRERSPDTVRMMLTGNADLQTAINAVNEGNIFRFMTKPCPPELFIEIIQSGIKQYRLVVAEQKLLQDTLTGSMKTLIDIVAMFNPTAFGRAARIAHYVKHMAELLDLKDAWEFELAGMLSQIGCVTMPPGTLDRLWDQANPSSEDAKLIKTHSTAARRLLENIPRLEDVAKMVGRQYEPYWNQQAVDNLADADRVTIGIQLLRVAMDLDSLLIRGLSFEIAWRRMNGRTGEYNPEILNALMNLRPEETEEQTREVNTAELQIGMIVAEDVVTKDGKPLVSKDNAITYPALLLIRSTAEAVGVTEPIRVRSHGWLSAAKNAPALEVAT